MPDCANAQAGIQRKKIKAAARKYFARRRFI